VPETRGSSSLDDWLGEVSDDDWSEQPAERAARRRATPVYQDLPAPAGEFSHDYGSARPPPARPVAAAGTRRGVVQRRRLAAGVVLAVLLGIGIATPVVLLSGGEQATVTQPTVTVTTTQPVVTSPTPEPGTTTTSPTTEPTTTPTEGAPAFVLPAGTKLQREGENDPVVVSQLQEALVDAGYDPGPADGTYGRQTEAAVVAFQQANGLSVDGRVGPETAEALNQALAGG
jgi:Putative peptidoglycan binding domain